MPKEENLDDRGTTRVFLDDNFDRQLPNQTLLANRYLIQDVVGLGGMGAVYRARDMHFPNVVKVVAVKEMINQAGDPLVRQTIVQNFEREANILVTLSHPSVPKIFDYFTHNERSYLVLEFVQGKDLEDILSTTDEFLPAQQVVAWAIELCDVLHYLHTHKPEPIIFRDMKPSNIMIDQNKHVVLVDFGIAKHFKIGQKGTMIGTEGYAPPEQYRGDATMAVDIYALGATLHHVFTKRDPRLEPPFTFSERPIRQINPAISPTLESIVYSALQYSPNDRFKSAETMKMALLSSVKDTDSISQIPDSIKTPVVLEKGVKPLWTFRCEDEIRGSPVLDGSSIYIGAYDNNLYAIDAVKGSFLWKYATDGGIVSRPTVCEDLVCFGSEDGLIYSVSTRGGRLVWTYQTEGPVRCSPRIAEGHLFVGSDDGYLYAINLVSGRLTWRIETNSPIRSMPCINGDRILYGSENGDVICADLRGDIRWRFKAKRAVFSSLLLDQGVVYFSSLDSTFYAVDAKSGWALWRFRMGKGSVSTPAKSENYLFVGSADGYIYCVESGNAKEIWRFKTDHQVSGSPIIYKNAVYCGSADGNLYCLERNNGHLRWKFTTGGPITGTPVIHNDIIYIGSVDHVLYALLA